MAAEAYYVPSGSMLPSLLVGDYLLVSKFPYGYSRYSLPLPLAPASSQRLLGKLPSAATWWCSACRATRPRPTSSGRSACRATACRCATAGCGERQDAAAAPRRHRSIEADDGALQPAPRFVETLPNGREHPIFKYRPNGELDDTQEFVVGAGQIFMMGDNRDNSLDSRVPGTAFGVGFVPVENLVGRVDVILGSWDAAVRGESFWMWPAGLRLGRFFSVVR